ncbi:MAG: molybdopterin-dependent oxidoreductase [Pyrinomonadaceae bacterium]|nr:molybdopterin-dependent oxidoreductase [Acidobacteriota bacterium]MBP7476740.1 molybdopterin-dependent oxidoreductase [Pyrinomonadaceae bacterium]MBP9110499.1 molybdopterin-dependent oxidoreductase [Pyrinomonadaceae bacterium]
MNNIDSHSHVRGESVYLDDIPVVRGTLYACVFDSPVAHGKLMSVDTSDAEKCEGVFKVITAKDLIGENQIGGIVPDEPLLAEGEVHFHGMPIAVVLADSEELARKAAKKITVEIDELEPVTDPRVAAANGDLIVPPKKFVLGDTANAFSNCAHVFEGKTEQNGQEHLYIETQGAYAVPTENGGLKIYSSTQGPTAVQRAVCRVTGLAMHEVEVDVQRLGGGFGGKEDQANAWAGVVAVATQLTKRPVKYALHRMEDMRMTGKRHPYSSDYKIGLDENLKVIAYEASFYQNAGASCDLSPPVLERTLFHCTNSYYIPNVTATAYCCRTNLPPNTAFRGFGGPQGMFVIESAIAHAAEKLGVPAAEIQRRNLIETGDAFPYGQIAESEAITSWTQAEGKFDFAVLQKEADDFNANSKYFRKGVATMPVCFGISFTKTPMNQARSLVHVYTDGSVAVSTGAVEMGQGVNTKMAQVAAKMFGLEIGDVKVHTTNTLRIANTSPTAASAAADLNGKATQIACETIRERLFEVAKELVEAARIEDLSLENGLVHHNGEKTSLSWQSLVMEAHLQRVNLSEHSHYATPGIGFDWSTAKGHPFAYHVYGTAIVGVTVDCLRGRYEIDYVKCCHDFGTSMNTAVDLGQIEGGIVQGLGWVTMEEVVYDEKGKLRSNALSTYKVPDIYSVPKEISVSPLETEKNNLAIFNSKAVGEPPLMYGIGAYFAIRNAVRAFTDCSPEFDLPFTPEKVLMNLYADNS